MSCMNDTDIGKDVTALVVLTGIQMFFCVTIIASIAALALYIRQQILLLQSLMRAILLPMTNEEFTEKDNCQKSDENDTIKDTDPINHVTAAEASSLPITNPVKLIGDIVQPDGTRKECKSDSELSIKNRLILLSKLQADLKDKVVYERCRLPFENINDLGNVSQMLEEI
ncbi:uncharacterized protein LOC133172131 [Saccostrea echinata]|uniref:uncharacterized protein LOC133172131 n=1 Tax=Saccostrea echinata TaxID=191078 RepID=UPI002A7FB036|nr:uncharacterized protein LOC133172131 [Saccostrea echinata]